MTSVLFKQRTESRMSTESTIKSNISNASSGYVIVSAPEKTRKPIPSFCPVEPLPDYDSDDSPHHSFERVQEAQEKKIPLLATETKVQSQYDDATNRKTIVRIDSYSQNISIEISEKSPDSTSPDQAFLYKKDATRQKKPCWKCTKREKCLAAVFIPIIVLLVVIIVLNFTVCLFDVTSACK